MTRQHRFKFLEQQEKPAKRRTLRPGEREADLMRDVFAWLKARGVFAWRMPVGAVIHREVRKGELQTHWKRSPLKGFPDVAGVLRRGRPGVFFALELKSPTGKVAPEQVSWMVDLQAAGAACAVIRSVDDLVRAMREWGEVP